jgi:hypothetical protein
VICIVLSCPDLVGCDTYSDVVGYQCISRPYCLLAMSDRLSDLSWVAC